MQIVLEEREFVALCTIVAVSVVESELPAVTLTDSDEKIAQTLDKLRMEAFYTLHVGDVEYYIDNRTEFLRNKIEKILAEKKPKTRGGQISEQDELDMEEI